MIPMEPGSEDSARHIAEQRRLMQEAQAIASVAHSRTGLMMRYLRRLANRIDPTGATRRPLR